MDSLPKLWQKTQTKVHEDTVVHNFPLYCPKCKTEARVDITQLKMTVNK
ncbi:MAG: conjugal transfer protein [Oscillospiraceae bacterium]|nr:conjugal transfer protein [Oscillospiraceae bacterium]